MMGVATLSESISVRAYLGGQAFDNDQQDGFLMKGIEILEDRCWIIG